MLVKIILKRKAAKKKPLEIGKKGYSADSTEYFSITIGSRRVGGL